ncbi:hypothetical protein ACIQZB_39505 [Streptomyces sp. NPDC097727]
MSSTAHTCGQRPAVPTRGLAVLDGLAAATLLTMDRLPPAGA